MGSGLSSMGLLRPTPGGRRGLARARARREGGATSKSREQRKCAGVCVRVYVSVSVCMSVCKSVCECECVCECMEECM